MARREKSTITLIDGDLYENKNSDRQAFCEPGLYKALAAAEIIQEDFPELSVWSEDLYIDEQNCYSLLQENDFVFLAVDNHDTRKIVSDRCEEFDNITLISGGNELTDGNIQVHIRRDGENLTLPIANKYHNEIMEPQDQSPARGCAAQVESFPQILIMNNFIAALMLNAFFGIIEHGAVDYRDVFADIVLNKARPEPTDRS